MNHAKEIVAFVILATLMVAITLFLSTGQYLFAIGSPGVLSGNVMQVPLRIPVNVCGNSLIEPRIGNSLGDAIKCITITSNSNSVYSIPSTFVKVDRFSTNYTIAGKISSLNASRDLISSTIVGNFDKNPNIGYVVNSSSALNVPSQPGLPNPYVNKDSINQKITNETQGAIATAFASNPIEKHVEIKCNFGMVLADYKCS